MPDDHGKGIHPFNGKVSSKIHDSLSPHSTRSRRSSSRARSPSQEVYLSFYDITLLKADYDTVRDGWLTDNVIAFWQEHLEHEYLSRSPRSKVILLRPAMAFMLMRSPSVEYLEGALPPMEKVTHVFLPINNNTDVEEAEGGSHWSLLLVSLKDNVAFHYDSMFPTNEDNARLATQKLKKYLRREEDFRFVDIEDSPQQSNSSDCGVYVCLLMRHLLVQKLLTRHLGEQVNMNVNHKDVDPRNGRREIRKIIDFERGKGEEKCVSRPFHLDLAKLIAVSHADLKAEVRALHEWDRRQRANLEITLFREIIEQACIPVVIGTWSI